MMTMDVFMPTEIPLLLAFLAGFLLFNAPALRTFILNKFSRVNTRKGVAGKQLAADFSSGQHEHVVQGFSRTSQTPDQVAMLVQSLLALGRSVEAVVREHTSASVQLAILEAVRGPAAVELAKLMRTKGQLAEPAGEALARGAVDDDEVLKLVVALGEGRGAYRDLVEDMLEQDRWRPAAMLLRAMHAKTYVPAHLVTQVVRRAVEATDLTAAVDLFDSFRASGEALTAALRGCEQEVASRGRCDQLERLVAVAAAKQVPMLYSSYEALLKAWARLSDGRAPRCFEDMAASCFSPTDHTCRQILEACIPGHHGALAKCVVQHLRAHERASAELCALASRADPKPKFRSRRPMQGFMQSVKQCAQARDAPKALQLLEEQRAANCVDVIACNAVLGVCVKSGDAAAARALIKDMRRWGMVDAASFNTLLGVKAPLPTVAQVDGLLAEMRSAGVPPSVVTYNTAINVAISQGAIDAAWQYVDAMDGAGLRMDAVTCTTLLKSLQLKGADIGRVQRLLETQKVAPDGVLIAGLLDACVRLKDDRRLSAALGAVRSAGIQPAAYSYATVIRAYTQMSTPAEARLRAARAVYAEFVAKRIQPIEPVCGALVECSVACGDVEAAAELLGSMKAVGPAPPAAYAAVVRGLAASDMPRAMALYAQMRTDKVQLHLVTYNALLDACSRVGDVDVMATLFRDMCDQGLVPDVVTYSTVIKGYAVQGDLQHAIALFTLMRKRGIKPDQILFNSILDGCARKGLRSLAEQVMRDMLEAHVPLTNHTLSILVKLYGRCNDVATAVEVVETLPKQHGFAVNTAVLTCLMKTCLDNGDTQRAREVFGAMEEPDAKAVETFAYGCLRQKKVVEAIACLEAARGLALPQKLLADAEIAAKRRRVPWPATLRCGA